MRQKSVVKRSRRVSAVARIAANSAPTEPFIAVSDSAAWQACAIGRAASSRESAPHDTIRSTSRAITSGLCPAAASTSIELPSTARITRTVVSARSM
jgi:hypothetical protein